MRIFNTLENKVNCWTFYDFAIMKLAEKYAYEEMINNEKVEDIASFICKCILYDYNMYTRYDMDTLANVVVRIVAKICKLKEKSHSTQSTTARSSERPNYSASELFDICL